MVPVAPEDARDQVRARLNLVEVVQAHVPLRRQGREWLGLCPFHQEKTPSFAVNEQKQSWYCHGCGKGGDLFTFVEMLEKTDFVGALRILAERAGVELAERSPGERRRAEGRRRVLELLRLAVRYYEHVLWETPAGEPGRRVLERRQVSPETARRFGLGFAPGAANLAGYLARRGHSMADAQAAGLLRGGRDYFQQRLLVPIRDERGQPLAFTGRTVRDGEPRKYVNTPETAVYIKGRVLFGLDVARPAIEERGCAVLMEGQFDVIAAHRSGLANAVASSGTALSADQVQLLRRYTEALVLMFDNDRAGRTAAGRAVELAQGGGLRTRVAAIPGEAKDPDELFRDGGRWEPVLEGAVPGWEFAIKEAIAGLDPGRPEGLEAALSAVNQVLGRISEPALRERYRAQAARWLGVEEHLLVYRPPAARPGSGPPPRHPQQTGLGLVRGGKKSLSSIDYLLQVLAVRPEVVARVKAELDPRDLAEEDRAAYFRMVDALERGGVEALIQELPSFPDEEERRVRRAWAVPPPGVDDAAVEDVLQRIRERAVRRRRRAIARDMDAAERRGDVAGWSALQGELETLSGRADLRRGLDGA